MEHFVAGTTARATAELVGIQPNTSLFYAFTSTDF
jgi:transposase-like protein